MDRSGSIFKTSMHSTWWMESFDLPYVQTAAECTENCSCRSRGPSCLAASAAEGRKLPCSKSCRWEEAFKDIASHHIQLVSYWRLCLLHSLVSHLSLLRLRLGPGHPEHPFSSVNRLSLAFLYDWHDSI